MSATVDAKLFSQALSKVSKVLKKSAIPVLEGVLVRIKDGACTLTATDFTTWLTTAIPVQGDDLAFVLQRPKDAARACGCFEGGLTLETEEKSSGKNHWLQLTMSCGPRTAQTTAILPEDYPVLPEVKARYTYSVNAARLLERVEHIKYALRKPDSKLEAKFTHVQFGGNKIFGVDGYRLAWDVNDDLIVRQPFMVLPEALRFLKFFGDEKININMGENYLEMTNRISTIRTRIEGPLVFNVDGAVPKEFTEEFYISSRECLDELDYLKKLACTSSKAHVYFSKGKLFLTAAGGNYSTQIQVEGESTIGFGFELDYMVDALRQFRGEPWIKVKVISPVAPIVLEAEGRSDFAMVLPVRMKEAAAA